MSSRKEEGQVIIKTLEVGVMLKIKFQQKIGTTFRKLKCLTVAFRA